MKSPSSDKQLQKLNLLLGLATKSDCYFMEQIKEAIDFNSNTLSPSEENRLFPLQVRRLLQLYLSGNTPPAFAHLEITSETYDPLWLRPQILKALRKLTGYPQSILLITGLPYVICPPGKKWSQKNRVQYKEAVQYIQKLIETNTSSGSTLHLLLL